MSRWIQHPITGKLIPADEYVRPSQKASACVHGDIQSFISPVDGSLIDDRRKLRDHNRAHGVTDSRDYSGDYIARRTEKRTECLNGAEAKRQRIETIQRAIDHHERN